MEVANDENIKAVETIAKARLVENIIDKITKEGAMANDPTSLGDLANDIYLSLLLDPKFPKVFQEHHENYYIARICINNICSSSSRYYRMYIMPFKKNLSIIEGIVKDEGGTDNNNNSE